MLVVALMAAASALYAGVVAASVALALWPAGLDPFERMMLALLGCGAALGSLALLGEKGCSAAGDPWTLERCQRSRLARLVVAGLAAFEVLTLVWFVVHSSRASTPPGLPTLLWLALSWSIVFWPSMRWAPAPSLCTRACCAFYAMSPPGALARLLAPPTVLYEYLCCTLRRRCPVLPLINLDTLDFAICADLSQAFAEGGPVDGPLPLRDVDLVEPAFQIA